MLTSTTNKVQYTITEGFHYPFGSSFPVTFKYWLGAEIHAILSFPVYTGKADQELVLNTDFSLSAPGNTGTLTRLTDWDHDAERLTIYRLMDIDQTTDYRNGEAVDMDLLEQDFDRANARVQQIDERIERTLQGSITDEEPLSEIPEATVRASQFLGFDAAGDVLVGQPVGVPATPWAQALLDDATLLVGQKTLGLIPSGASAVISAFIQSLLDDADAPAAQATLQFPEFLKSRLLWTSADLVGSGLAITGIGVSALAALNATDVAFFDDTLESLKTYRFNGSTWALVGSGLSITGAGFPALAALNGTDVAFFDNTLDSLRTYRFNGSTWALVGSGLSITGAGAAALAALNGTDVAFFDSTLALLRTYRFNGSTWSLVGSGLSIAGIGNISLAALNGTDVAFVDSTLESLRTYRFNGSTWSLVGSGLDITGAGYPALAALNATDVAFIDFDLASLKTYRFNGSTWALVGSGLSITGAGFPALAALNGTDVAFIDNTLESLRTYRFAFALEAPYHP